MKLTYIALIMMTGFLSACSEIPSTSTDVNTPDVDFKYTLKNPFRIEVIEADIRHVPTPVRANGKIHLSYELTILNHHRRGFTLNQIEVVNPESPEKPLAIFDSNYLDQHFVRHGKRPPTGDRLLEGNTFGVANLWTSIPEFEKPSSIFHRLTFELIGGDGELQKAIVEVARLPILNATKVVIGQPFENGRWLYSTGSHRNSRYMTEGHASYAQRYATDWLKITNDGVLIDGDDSLNESFVTYGVPLLAVADGIVVNVQDGIIENIPFSEEMAVPMSRKTVTGNHIMLDIGNGLNAVYAHLIPGSLKVAVGDRVTKGDVIGLLGNSGSSDAPHLHFHLETQTGANRPVSGEGVPFHYEVFDQITTYTDEEFEVFFDKSELDLKDTQPIPKELEFPLWNGVVDFK